MNQKRSTQFNVKPKCPFCSAYLIPTMVDSGEGVWVFGWCCDCLDSELVEHGDLEIEGCLYIHSEINETD